MSDIEIIFDDTFKTDEHVHTDFELFRIKFINDPEPLILPTTYKNSDQSQKIVINQPILPF